MSVQIIEKDGKPEWVVIPFSEYKRLQEALEDTEDTKDIKETLKALQELAAAHRDRHGCRIIGITGSNGKTIVKEWINQALSPDQKIVRSPKSYNSQLGVPLSVLLLEQNTETGIFKPTAALNILAPLMPNWAKGEIKIVNAGFPQ